jgi:hypothetical protein
MKAKRNDHEWADVKASKIISTYLETFLPYDASPIGLEFTGHTGRP